jgi:hypothetical protein
MWVSFGYYLLVIRSVGMPHNKSLQRSGTNKVLGRGREMSVPWRAPSARVLKHTRAAAELGR